MLRRIRTERRKREHTSMFLLKVVTRLLRALRGVLGIWVLGGIGEI